MKLITRDTDYAIRALAFIAGHKKEVVSVSRLVEELKIPRPFLRKILQVLERNGLLKSYKGKGGGFTLAVSPGKISLIGLIRIFQGPFRLNECFFKKRACPNTATCALKKRIDKIEKYIFAEISSLNLGLLLR